MHQRACRDRRLVGGGATAPRRWCRASRAVGRDHLFPLGRVWHDGTVSVVTIFRSRVREGAEAAYGQVADEMSSLARTMEGFIDEKFYLSREGERVTIVRFRDVDSQRAWSQHPLHLAAQQRGRDEFYVWYDISVCDESYSRVFRAAD